MITYFKGTEAQGYFEKLFVGKITMSYKPQQVEQIPKAFAGNVIDLLKKTNEKGDAELARVLKVLDIEHVADRDLTVISGGELQRVAIAATVLKQANVYYFDEPTSYLDIKQRLRVAKFLKELATPETAVMVIEHDLIILDFMTDLIHILYGKEDVYGIVSQPRATKAGINTYLDGYIKDENIRFRDKRIQFTSRPPIDDRKDEQLAEWPAITEKLGSFTLEAHEGKIQKHDVIGVLGENGIGKTTFVRALAALGGETKRGALAISYKPQYLEAGDEHVGTFLLKAMAYKTHLIDALELEPLLDRKTSELSGGQLQRVMIARALAEDADLFLLDEPSAYLDVEQRLSVSRILRELMELKGKACLVVDHDLLFIDYLSRKLIVFDGEPGRHGLAKGPYTLTEGMNHFLRDLGITFRRDEENNRPRANKGASVLDREQKASGKLYYA